MSPDPRELPQELDAERSVLAAMMLGPEAMKRARALLEPRHFYRQSHAYIFAAITGLDDRSVPADLITLAAELKRLDRLELVGGVAALAQILEYATTTFNTEYHARLIREAFAKREIIEAGERLANTARNGSDPMELARTMAQDASRIAEAHASLSGPGRFAAAALNLPDLLSAEFPTRRPLLAGGLLSAGDVAILYGQAGLGKTWLALLLALCDSRGAPWLGLETGEPGARVGMIELEVHSRPLQERCREMIGAMGESIHDPDVELVARPGLSGAVDFCDPAQARDLERWIVEKRLSLVVLDPLSRIHSAKESSEMDVPLRAFESIAQSTGCALLILHHERKEQANAPKNDLDALRGDSRLQSNPTLLMRLVKLRDGLLSLRFVKVNLGAEPRPIHFTRGTDGLPILTRPPEESREANRAKILEAIRGAAPATVSAVELCQLTDLSKPTVKRYLSEIHRAGEIEVHGAGKSVRYRLSSGSPALAALFPSEPLAERWDIKD